jgi:hypothetical protein
MRASLKIHNISSDYVTEASTLRQSLDKCDSCFEDSVTNAHPKLWVCKAALTRAIRVVKVTASDNSRFNINLPIEAHIEVTVISQSLRLS